MDEEDSEEEKNEAEDLEEDAENETVMGRTHRPRSAGVSSRMKSMTVLKNSKEMFSASSLITSAVKSAATESSVSN